MMYKEIVNAVEKVIYEREIDNFILPNDGKVVFSAVKKEKYVSLNAKFTEMDDVDVDIDEIYMPVYYIKIVKTVDGVSESTEVITGVTMQSVNEAVRFLKRVFFFSLEDVAGLLEDIALPNADEFDKQAYILAKKRLRYLSFPKDIIEAFVNKEVEVTII